jgi:hypothetical protein
MEIKTNNDSKHNYSKNFKKYLKTNSTRTLEAIYRTKRLDAGFFWMEFYPLVRDIFFAKHNDVLYERDFELLWQLHANQPFTIDDIMWNIIPKRINDEKWHEKTSYGIRATKDFIQRCLFHKIIELKKKNGRYNKKQYELTYEMKSEFRRMYEQMLCISKIRLADTPEKIRKSKPHYKKILKQNTYKDAFDSELNREIETSDGEFAIKIQQARALSRKF